MFFFSSLNASPETDANALFSHYTDWSPERDYLVANGREQVIVSPWRFGNHGRRKLWNDG